MSTPCRSQDSGLDVLNSHKQDARQKCPLIRVGTQLRVDKHTTTPLPRSLLQRQSDEITKAALGHGVLIRKQPIIGLQLQLSATRAGMADDGGTQAPSIACRHPTGEKHPDMGALARAGNLQRRRYTQLLTRANYRAGILAPIGLIKIDGQKMAGVILQERINTHSVATSKMIVNHIIGEGAQPAVMAVSTLDSRFFANPGTPFVGTGRSVA